MPPETTLSQKNSTDAISGAAQFKSIDKKDIFFTSTLLNVLGIRPRMI